MQESGGFKWGLAPQNSKGHELSNSIISRILGEQVPISTSSGFLSAYRQAHGPHAFLKPLRVPYGCKF